MFGVVAWTDNENSTMKNLFVTLMLLTATSAFAQDVLEQQDGSTLLVKVVEITSNEVKYKKYSNVDGPSYTLPLNEIRSLTYENGEKETFVSIKNKEQVQEKTTHVLKAGTPIPLKISKAVKAAELNEGQSVQFYVDRDIVVDGITIIPYMTSVYGSVYMAKKSSWFGTKGKLGILINNLSLPNGVNIPLNNGDAFVTGKNRTVLSVLLFLFVTWPACFICGTKAEMHYGYEVVACTGRSVEFDNNGNCTLMDNAVFASSLDVDFVNRAYPCSATIFTKDGKSINAMITSANNEQVTYVEKSKYKAKKPSKNSNTLSTSLINNIFFQ